MSAFKSLSDRFHNIYYTLDMKLKFFFNCHSQTPAKVIGQYQPRTGSSISESRKLWRPLATSESVFGHFTHAQK